MINLSALTAEPTVLAGLPVLCVQSEASKVFASLLALCIHCRSLSTSRTCMTCPHKQLQADL